MINFASKKQRYLFINVATALGVVIFFWWLISAIFEKFNYHWNWSPVLNYVIRETDDGYKAGLLVDGFLMTIRLTIWGALLTTFFGLVVGVMYSSRLYALRAFAYGFVEIIRNMPPLVFIFVMYFFVSSQLIPVWLISDIANLIEENPFLETLFGSPDTIENFLAGLLTIALYEAAYIAEIVRGGIQSIERGQWEASKALGISRWLTMRKIILPQAIRKVVPTYTNQLISLVKDSSIISVISVQELTFSGIEVATTTGRLFETMMLIALMYLLICLPAALILRKAEQPQSVKL